MNMLVVKVGAFDAFIKKKNIIYKKCDLLYKILLVLVTSCNIYRHQQHCF